MASGATDRHPDEETPLLQGEVKPLPPWGQISLAYLTCFAEPVASSYILPFINQLVKELGVTEGDDRKIGYYAGLIESLFFVTQACTTWQWSRLSDFIGRRPVILMGLLGLSISTFSFGLSRTYVMLVTSRCIAGILNGNAGVMKSILGDLVDDTNLAQVSAFVPATFIAGMTIASLYGGVLTKPHERWPHIFWGEFWVTYPYFLPSLISGCFILFIFLLCAMFLRESLPSEAVERPQPPQSVHPTVDNPREIPLIDDARPASMSTLLTTYSVMIPALNYGMLALMEVGCYILLPLFYSSPIRIGGLGFSPSTIGILLAIFGVVDGCLQGLLAPKLIKWLGAKRVFCCTIPGFYLVTLLFPIMSAVVTAQGRVGPIIFMLLAVQLLGVVLIDMSFTVVFILVMRAAPNKQSLGSVNGLSQSFASIARAIGPALTTSLFAASKQYDILEGNFVYVIMVLLATILVGLSRLLPDSIEEKEE